MGSTGPAAGGVAIPRLALGAGSNKIPRVDGVTPRRNRQYMGEAIGRLMRAAPGPSRALGQAASREYSLISPSTRFRRITGPSATAESRVGARGGRNSRLRWGVNSL